MLKYLFIYAMVIVSDDFFCIFPTLIFLCSLILFFLDFIIFFLLYNIVLVLPYTMADACWCMAKNNFFLKSEL